MPRSKITAALRRVLGLTFASPVRTSVNASRANRFRPMLECFEDRLVPTTVSVTALGDVLEGGATTFRVTRDLTSRLGAVNLSFSGTATSGTDYSALSTTVLFANGLTSMDVTVTALADSEVEGDETIIATVESGTGYTPSGSPATVTITDDPPVVSVSVASTTEVHEGGSAGGFSVTRTGGDLSQSLTVNYSVGGTATSGTDYIALSGSVTIPADLDYADVIVTALADSAVEGSETIIATLTSGTGYSIGSTPTWTLTITDDPPVVSVIAVADAVEGGAKGYFRVVRSGDLSAALSVGFTISGSATAGDDYAALTPVAAFAPNQNFVDIEVDAGNDGVEESTEDVSLSIIESSAFVIGAGVANLNIFNVDPNAPGPPADVVFDLDVNANGSLADPVDLAVNYLPGYEGNTPKVSTNTNFNTDAYVGQRMKLILDGVGTNNMAVTRVDFVLVAVSQWTGYASNKTSPTVTGGDKNDDYSFAKDLNYLNAQQKKTFTITRTSVEEIAGTQTGVWYQGGKMEATKTWVNFYAKDYGGAAWLEARVFVSDGMGGEKLAYPGIPLAVPKDVDTDGLADKWELAMYNRWVVQYQEIINFDLAMFSPNDDKEQRDPDGVGGPLVNQADEGDAHTVLEEYRGYILDGGGYDGQGQNRHTGGHIRLDPARKELLVEVDRAASLANVPQGGLGFLLDNASKVFSNADRGAGIYMYYVFDQVNLPIAPVDVDTTAKQRDLLGTTRNADLRSDFHHLLFYDEGNITAFGSNAGAYGAAGMLAAGKRGVVFATTDSDIRYPSADYPDQAEAFGCVIAHELVHLLVADGTGGAFDENEHVADPAQDGLPNAAEELTELMLTSRSRANREVATVRIYPCVQAELALRTSEGLSP